MPSNRSSGTPYPAGVRDPVDGDDDDRAAALGVGRLLEIRLGQQGLEARLAGLDDLAEQ